MRLFFILEISRRCHLLVMGCLEIGSWVSNNDKRNTGHVFLTFGFCFLSLKKLEKIKRGAGGHDLLHILSPWTHYCNHFVFYAGLNVGELSRTSSCLLASGNVMSLLRDIRMVDTYRSEMELEMLGQIIFRWSSFASVCIFQVILFLVHLFDACIMSTSLPDYKL